VFRWRCTPLHTAALRCTPTGKEAKYGWPRWREHVEGKGEQTEAVANERIVAEGHSSVPDLKQIVLLEQPDDHKARFTSIDELTILRVG
jgi:hypothetical protein